MPLILGGLAIAGGLAAGLMGGGQGKASALQQELAARNENFRQKWKNEAENRNLLRQMQAQLVANAQIEQAATTERAASEFSAKKGYLNTKSTLSKQTQQTNDMFASTAIARNISMDSASVKALLRQNTQNAETNMATLRANYGSMLKDIETKYENRLASRNLGYISQRLFVPQAEMSVDNSSSALMSGIVSGVIGGVSAGYGSYLEHGATLTPWKKS